MDTEELEVRTSEFSRAHHTHLILVSRIPQLLGWYSAVQFLGGGSSGVKTWSEVKMRLLPNNDDASLSTCVPASSGSHVHRAQALQRHDDPGETAGV